MQTHQLLGLGLSFANYLSFVLGAFLFFQKRGPIDKGLNYLAFIAIGSMIALLSALWISTAPFNLWYGFGLGLMLLSSILFWLCVRVNYRYKLSPAYSQDSPTHLMRMGPYRYIRHPYYTSYILTHLGAAIASQLWWALIPLLLIVGLYLHASRYEEAKFASSELAQAYQHYKQEAGRFLPRLRRTIRSL